MQFDKILHQLKQRQDNLKVIIFTDPGLDDALMLLQMLCSNKYEVSGVIPVAGNVSLEIARKNTLNICEYINCLKAPIYPGSIDKITTVLDVPIYGEHGLSKINLPQAKKLQVQSQRGIDFAFKVLQKIPHILISTAVLTEPACLLEKLKQESPTRLHNILGIFMMGGVINPTQEANWPIKDESFSEANLGYDASASQKVFEICEKYCIPIFLVPLDLTHSILASENDLSILKSLKTPQAKLGVELIQAVPEHYQKRYGKGPDKKYRQPLHDVHVSHCLLHPELYTGHWTNLSVYNKIFPQQIVIKSSTLGNVFLLDMHYFYRKDFFNLFAQDLS